MKDFQPARTLITVILMRHMLISPIDEGVWGETSSYPSSLYVGLSRTASDPNSTPPPHPPDLGCCSMKNTAEQLGRSLKRGVIQSYSDVKGRGFYSRESWGKIPQINTAFLDGRFENWMNELSLC